MACPPTGHVVSGHFLFHAAAFSKQTPVLKQTLLLEDHGHELEHVIHELDAHMFGLEAHVHTLERLIHELDTHVFELEAHVQRLEHMIHELEAHVFELEAHVQGLEHVIHELDSHVFGLEAHIHGLEHVIHELDAHVFRLETHVPAWNIAYMNCPPVSGDGKIQYMCWGHPSNSWKVRWPCSNHRK